MTGSCPFNRSWAGPELRRLSLVFAARSNNNIDDDDDDDDGLMPATPHWRVQCGEESFQVDGTMWPRVEQPPLP